MNERFTTPHESPITLAALVERLQRTIPVGHEIVLVQDRHKLPRLDRWIIGASAETFSPTVVWLPAGEQGQVFAALGRFWKPSWGAGDTCRAVPAARDPWSILWTLGPSPLRVWTRRGLLLSIDDQAVRGVLTRGRTYNPSDIVKSDVERRWGRLRVACVLHLWDGGKLTVVAGWFPSLWSLYDDEDYEFDVLAPLAVRINGALHLVAQSVRVAER